MNLIRALPPGVLWLFVSAALFLVNAAALSSKGQTQLAEIGLILGIVAIVIAIAFGDWTNRYERRR